MYKSSPELKSMAKQALIGRYGITIGAHMLYAFLYLIISFFLGMLFPGTQPLTLFLHYIASMIVSLLISVLVAGLSKLILNISRDQPYEFNDLFFAFSNRPDRIILINLLINLIFIACSLPAFIVYYFAVSANSVPLMLLAVFLLLAALIAYIVISLSYALTTYLYLDNPEKGVMEIMNESKELMRGHKGRLFYISISFIGLILLSVLTCYVGLLWLSPYMEMTQAYFYRNIIGEI